MKSTLKTLVLITAFSGLAVVNTSCNNSYLSPKQNATLNSTRVIEGTDDQAYEINYTADYRVDEFIDTISKEGIYDTDECRMTMKGLLAKGSNIEPLGRLTNDMHGCSSVICKNPNGEWMIGRNYDLDIRSNGATVVIHTAPDGGYKSVGMADGGQFGLSCSDLKKKTNNRELLLYAPYFTMDGVNEKGFACSIMLLNEGMNVQYSRKKWLPSTLLVRYLLDNADSVDNAIKLLNRMDFRNDYLINPILAMISDISFHWAIADVTGNRAIIEYVKGAMKINTQPVEVQYKEDDDTATITHPKEKKDYLISTNFYVTEEFENTKSDTGRWRYQTLKAEMEKNDTPTKEQLRDVMKSAKYLMNDKEYIYKMKQEGLDPTNPDNWDWITIWTDVLNTNEKSLSLWMRENYEVEKTFKLEYQER